MSVGVGVNGHGKNLASTGIRFLTVQPVMSCYIDYAILAANCKHSEKFSMPQQ